MHSLLYMIFLNRTTFTFTTCVSEEPQKEPSQLAESHFVTVVNIVRLKKYLATPPLSAKLLALWWWLEGNIDKDRLRSDLLKMKSLCLAGILLFDAGSSSHRSVTRTQGCPQLKRETLQLIIFLNFNYLAELWILFTIQDKAFLYLPLHSNFIFTKYNNHVDKITTNVE